MKIKGNTVTLSKRDQKKLGTVGLHIDLTDKVNHPAHYNRGEIECIEFIEDQGHGASFTVGNAMKYLTRAGAKGDELEDLRKAIWYTMRRAEQVKAAREKRKPIRPNQMPKVPV